MQEVCAALPAGLAELESQLTQVVEVVEPVATDHLPATQREQEEPALGLYFPAVHVEQAEAISSKPGEQAQEELPAVEVLLAGQAVQP